MKVLDRRDFLKLSGAGAGALAVARLARPAPAAAGPATFQHGVASGDPTSGSFLIWTRVTPEADALPGSGIGSPTEVRWQVATDPGFKRVVRDGIARATTVRDHTVKVDVRGLEPDRFYHYRFKTLGDVSETGRARTFPEAKAEAESVRFGLASCANFEGGYFAAYGYLAERADLDFVLHMGDYIYEYAPGGYGPGAEIGTGARARSRDRQPRRLPDAPCSVQDGSSPPGLSRGAPIHHRVGRP